MAQQLVPAQLPLIARQPFSTIYKVCCLATILARTPYWALKYALFPSLRPLPTWTLKQSLLLALIKSILDAFCVAQTPTPLSLDPGKEKERFCIAKPASKSNYVGPLQSDAVSPASVGITWFPRTHTPTDAHSSSIVVLHVHGGAFVIGDGRTDQMEFGASLLLRHADVSCVYSAQYRLACRPDSVPFPGALQDVLTSYLYLVRHLRIPPDHIVLSGDSAGGNLIIALLRYLVEYGSELTDEDGGDGIPLLPHSAVLFSPWVAPENCIGPDLLVASNPNYGSDYLTPSFLRWGAQDYARLVPASDPYISPLGHPFVTPVPMFVTVSAAEILAVEAARWVREMREACAADGGDDGKNDIEFNYEDGAPHDTFLFGAKSGWEDSAREVTTKIGQFIRRKSRASSWAGRLKSGST